MKKYNLSKIMKRAWTFVRELSLGISSALKKAWREAKNMNKEIVTFNVSGNDTFTVNTKSGEISGKTYRAKEWIKSNFNAKWNPDKKMWVADPKTITSELENARYYSKYIIDTVDGEIIRKELVNRQDGFYSRNIHQSGKITYAFVG